MTCFFKIHQEMLRYDASHFVVFSCFHVWLVCCCHVILQVKKGYDEEQIPSWNTSACSPLVSSNKGTKRILEHTRRTCVLVVSSLMPRGSDLIMRQDMRQRSRTIIGRTQKKKTSLTSCCHFFLWIALSSSLILEDFFFLGEKKTSLKWCQPHQRW